MNVSDVADQSHSSGGSSHTKGRKLVVGKIASRHPHAFREELQRGFSLILRQPDIGASATNVKLKDVRRSHLSRIRYFLYYRVKEGRVEVLALWDSSRLKGPRLKEPPNKPLQPTAQKRVAAERQNRWAAD